MPDRLPVIYIAGPYRAPTPWRILANIRAAQEVALVVWRLGGVAICPHANTALFDSEAPDAVWLDGDLELIRRCDAMLMVDNWRNSAGATAEYNLANELGLPVFLSGAYNDSNVLKEWMDGWKKTRRTEAERSAADVDLNRYLACGPPWD